MPSRYRNKAKRIAAMLAKKPFSSKQQLVKHTEFAAQFGAIWKEINNFFLLNYSFLMKKQLDHPSSGPSSALRPQSHDMSFVEYHNIDIVVVLVLISFGIGLLIIYILLKKIFGKRVVKTKKE